MAVLASRASVGTTVTRLDIPGTVTRYAITIINRGTVSIFVGGSAVAESTGLELAAGERMSMTLRPSDGGLFAISTVAGQRVDRLQVGWS